MRSRGHVQMGQWNLANLKKTIYYLRRNGLAATWYAARERLFSAPDGQYLYREPGEEVLREQRAAGLSFQGTFSVVVPCYHTPRRYLRELIDSLLQQTYARWELLLADATEDDSVERVAREYTDERLRYIRLPRNGGISENTNQGIAHAMGEYIGLLDHDDVLAPDALYEMAAAIAGAMEAGVRPDFLYSDEDKCDDTCSRYYEPHFKEDLNLDLLLSNNYICHFLVMESSLIKKLQLRAAYDGAQDYDLVLRAVASRLWEGPAAHAETLVTGERRGEPLQRYFLHVPKVLYHWRCHEASTAENPASKEYAYSMGLLALQTFAGERGWRARGVELRHRGFYRLEYEESVFAVREDIGAVGGRVLAAGKLVGGRLDAEGNVFYAGLSKHYSGYMHRAVLPQDAEAVDLRCICIRRDCIGLFEKVTGTSYITKKLPKSDVEVFDPATLPEGTDIAALSVRLGVALREAGLRILWLPTFAEVDISRNRGKKQCAEDEI